jgi:hypothetical protein
VSQTTHIPQIACLASTSLLPLYFLRAWLQLPASASGRVARPKTEQARILSALKPSIPERLTPEREME